jgi:DNA ligase (NAD+)
MERKREELEQMVIDAGGTVKSSVGSGLTYLVIADPESTSTKAVKARKLGTKLISEAQFLKMVSR